MGDCPGAFAPSGWGTSGEVRSGEGLAFVGDEGAAVLRTDKALEGRPRRGDGCASRPVRFTGECRPAVLAGRPEKEVENPPHRVGDVDNVAFSTGSRSTKFIGKSLSKEKSSNFKKTHKQGNKKKLWTLFKKLFDQPTNQPIRF